MGIKSNIDRVDAIAKVTGRAKYTEDLIPGNALVAKLLHSTIANGRVIHIDIDEAKKIKGVEMILTCFDIPQIKYATAGHPHSIDPDHLDVATKTMLTDRIKYYGDEIAVVVARDEIIADRALEKIRVCYEIYEPYRHPDEALSSKDILHEDYPKNILSRMDFEIDGNDVSFSEEEYEAKEKIPGFENMECTGFFLPTVQHVHIENICCFAYMENKQIIVVSPSQMPHTLRHHISEALDKKLSDIRVIKPYVGGGFGNKQDTYFEPLAALLSERLNGACVAIVLNRHETFVNSRVRHAMDIVSAQRADDEGNLVDRGVIINAYSGAYGSNGHAVAAYAVTNFFQLYPVKGKQIGRSMSFYSNIPSAGAMRGYGIPQITFAMEAQIDDIAYKNNWDPLWFRKRNIMPKDFFDPFDKFYCQSNGLLECISVGSEKMEWKSKRIMYDKLNQNSSDIKYGVGMAVFAYKTGVYPIQLETASSRFLLNEDGTVEVQVGSTELGQGSDTVMLQIASESTGIPEADIRIVSFQDTDVSPHDAGAYASRQTYVSGGAVKKVGLLFKEKIIERAAMLAGISSKDLTIEKGKVCSAIDKKVVMTVGDVAMRMQYENNLTRASEHITAEATHTAHSNCFSFGASFVDLEVDIRIGKIKINKVIAVHDSGNILNEHLARGQVQGGVVMGLGYAVTEQMLFDKQTLRPLNANLLDYKIPTSMDIPPIEVYFVDTWEPTGPYGNKGLAEPPVIPQAPAVRNAVLHATGVGINTLPLNPENLIHNFKKFGII